MRERRAFRNGTKAVIKGSYCAGKWFPVAFFPETEVFP